MRTLTRSLAIAGVLCLLSSGCRTAIGPFACGGDVPPWLEDRLHALADESDAFGTRVYRYRWGGEVVYHLEAPFSSCAYCELYDAEGDRLQFTDPDVFADFLANKEDDTLLCEWNG